MNMDHERESQAAPPVRSSEIAHTPGPWSVGYEALDVIAVSPKGGFCKICDIRGWGHLTGKGFGALGLPHEEAKAIQVANARLIAAAPDMLHALKMLTQVWSQVLANRHGSTAEEQREPVLNCARAAIAKATMTAPQDEPAPISREKTS